MEQLLRLEDVYNEICLAGTVTEDDLKIIRLVANKNVKSASIKKKVCRALIDCSNTNNYEDIVQTLELYLDVEKVEYQLDQIKQKVEKRENIGLELLKLINNKEVVAEIHNLAEMNLSKACNQYTSCYIEDVPIVFISLTIIALLSYDGKFYDHVESVYSYLYQNYKKQKIESVIRSMLKHQDSDSMYSSDPHRLINVVLRNSIVPKYYLMDYYDFIFDIYQINFRMSLPSTSEIKEELSFIFGVLSEGDLNNIDRIENNSTKKVYKLIHTTQELMKSPNILIEYSQCILQGINSYIQNLDDSITSKFIEDSIKEWAKTKKNINSKVLNRTRENVERTAWEPKYLYKNQKIYLVPPSHKIKNIENHEDLLSIIHYKDGRKILCKKTRVAQIVGGYDISFDEIEIANPLEDLEYLVFYKNNLRYTSKETLNRRFIFFDQNGQEIKNNTDYEGIVVACCKDKLGIASFVDSNKYFTLSCFNATKNQVIEVDGSAFSFAKSNKPGILGSRLEHHYLRSINCSKLLSVYKEIHGILLDRVFDNEVFEVKIGEMTFVSNNLNTTLERFDNKYRYLISLPEIKSNIYHVFVKSISTGEILYQETIAIDKLLEYGVNDVGMDRKQLSLTSDFCEGKQVFEFTNTDFNKDLIVISYKFHQYVYHLPIEIAIYRLNGTKWVSYDNEIWHEDNKGNHTLEFWGRKYDGIQIQNSHGKELYTCVELKNTELKQEVNIEFLKSYFNDNLYLHLLSAGRIAGQLSYLNHIIVSKEKTMIWYDESKECLVIKPWFRGKGSVDVKILDSNQRKIFETENIGNGVEVINPNVTGFEEYTIQFYEPKKMFDLSKPNLLYQAKRVFYPKDSLIDQTFIIESAKFERWINNIPKEYPYVFRKTYLEIIDDTGDGRFVGQLYYLKNDYKVNLNNINPIEVEVCGQDEDGRLKIVLTKDDDGLLIDFSNQTVCNSTELRNADDIVSCVISLHEGEVNE